MKPIYECTDRAPGKRWEVFFPLLIAFMCLIILMYDHPLKRQLFLGIIILLAILQTLTFWPLNRIRVFQTHIVINFGAWLIFRKSIKNENIILVQDASNWTNDRLRQWSWWNSRSLLLRRDGAILAFRITARRLLISSPNRIEILSALQSVLGEEKVIFDPGPSLILGDSSTEAWKPMIAEFPPESEIDLNKPLYRYVESYAFVFWVIIGLFFLFVLIPPYFNERPPSPADTILMFLILGFITVIIAYLTDKFVIMRNKVTFYPNRIQFQLGLFALEKHVIEMSRIRSIQPVVADFGAGFIRTISEPRKIIGTGIWKGWKGFFVTEYNTALAIETDGENVVVGCTNSEEISEKLKTLLNGVVTGSQKP